MDKNPAYGLRFARQHFSESPSVRSPWPPARSACDVGSGPRFAAPCLLPRRWGDVRKGRGKSAATSAPVSLCRIDTAKPRNEVARCADRCRPAGTMDLRLSDEEKGVAEEAAANRRRGRRISATSATTPSMQAELRGRGVLGVGTLELGGRAAQKAEGWGLGFECIVQ